jgi:thioredoxin reductase (NADPH)
MREVTGVRRERSWRALAISDGREVRAASVILAMGVTYRRLGIPALERLIGTGVFYGASPAEGAIYADRRVVVVGAGNSAGQAAVHLRRFTRYVMLVVRGSTLAASMSQYLVDEIDALGIAIRFSTEVVDGGGEHQLEWLALRDATGATQTEPADALFVMIGAQPHTVWLPREIARDRQGFVLTGPQPVGSEPASASALARPALAFETTMPGVFAIGDVRALSVKRVASAVGEGSVVISHVHQYLQAREHPAGAAAP